MLCDHRVSHLATKKVIGCGVCLLYTQLAHSKPSLVNTRSLCSRTEHIVNIGDVIWRSYPFRLLEETELKQQSSAGLNYPNRCTHATGMTRGGVDPYYGAESIR